MQYVNGGSCRMGWVWINVYWLEKTLPQSQISYPMCFHHQLKNSWTQKRRALNWTSRKEVAWCNSASRHQSFSSSWHCQGGFWFGGHLVGPSSEYLGYAWNYGTIRSSSSNFGWIPSLAFCCTWGRHRWTSIQLAWSLIRGIPQDTSPWPLLI